MFAEYIANDVRLWISHIEYVEGLNKLMIGPVHERLNLSQGPLTGCNDSPVNPQAFFFIGTPL